MYGCKSKVIVVYVMTWINSLAGLVFLYLFMKVFTAIEFSPYHEDYGDYEVSKTTVMVHNVPPHLPVIEANTLLGQIFKSRFKNDLEAVHTVGRYDKAKLDYLYSKSNYLEDRLEVYADNKLRNNVQEEKITIYSKDFCSKFLNVIT